MAQLFDELKRRNVFRVAVAYIVTCWLLLQVADVVLGNIEAPGWIFSVFLLALGLGFIPVLFFSWAYELTPEGLKRESEVDRSQSITSATGRKLDIITIAMLVAVVGFVMMERTFFRAEAPIASEVRATVEEVSEPPPVEVAATVVSDKSIAVLAFEDLSAQGDQAFFAEGLSEELLNVLAQVPSLKVAGRTSSFAFKGKDTDLREIGEILNVAHILEGSVRKAGNRIRVTAQLIKAEDGFHLFSQTYDRDLDDIFSVQDELAALIGNALQAELGAADAIPAATPTNLEAYDLYLLARQRIRSRDPESMFEAIELLDQALAIDRDYAPALAQRALAVYLLSDNPGSYGDIPAAQALPEAMDLLDKALALDPGLAEAYAILGLVQTDRRNDAEDAVPNLERALEINPNLESAKLWLANAIEDEQRSQALYEEVVLRDPMYRPAFNNLIQGYLGKSEFDSSDALITRVERITGVDAAIHQARGSADFMKGELASALRHLDIALEANPNASIVSMWHAYVLLQLGELDRATANSWAPIRLIALGQLGDIEAADQELNGIDFQGATGRAIRHAADYLAAAGRGADMVAIIDDEFGGIPALLETFRMTEGAYGSEYLGPLAYAYRQAGRDSDFDVLMDEMERALSAQESIGIDNWYHWYCRAQQAALKGDAGAATAYLQRAVNEGLASVIFIEPLFETMADNAAFQAVAGQMVARAQQERAALGLPRYRAAPATN